MMGWVLVWLGVTTGLASPVRVHHMELAAPVDLSAVETLQVRTSGDEALGTLVLEAVVAAIQDPLRTMGSAKADVVQGWHRPDGVRVVDDGADAHWQIDVTSDIRSEFRERRGSRRGASSVTTTDVASILDGADVGVPCERQVVSVQLHWQLNDRHAAELGRGRHGEDRSVEWCLGDEEVLPDTMMRDMLGDLARELVDQVMPSMVEVELPYEGSRADLRTFPEAICAIQRADAEQDAQVLGAMASLLEVRGFLSLAREMFEGLGREEDIARIDTGALSHVQRLPPGAWRARPAERLADLCPVDAADRRPGLPMVVRREGFLRVAARPDALSIDLLEEGTVVEALSRWKRWTEVRLQNGKEGWLPTQDLRRP